MSTNAPRYPHVTAQLTDIKENSVFAIAAVLRALKTANVEEKELDNFLSEATVGDRSHVLETCYKWVRII